MSREALRIWFLNVGHGDSAYIEMPNGAKMMIDCGGSLNWASKLLEYYGITKEKNPNKWGFALDELVISHPHGDHISDIVSVHDEIGFKWLAGGYSSFIDDIDPESMDYRKRNRDAISKFIDVVKNYTGEYKMEEDMVIAANPPCKTDQRRFLGFERGMDLNELSRFVSLEIGGQKVLFTGDMTATGVKKILDSKQASHFSEFVKGATVLKVPHHGRENGCSEELFEAFNGTPLLCIASDKVLDEQIEGTSNIDWYTNRTSDENILIDGVLQNRKILTTRKDGDIFMSIDTEGNIQVVTHSLKEVRSKIL